MHPIRWKRYLALGLTGFCSISLSILFFFCIFRIQGLGDWLQSLFSILQPFIYGGVIAYLLTPICSYLERKLNPLFSKLCHDTMAARLTKAFAVCFSLILGIAVVGALIYVALPQVWESILSIAAEAPNNWKRFIAWLQAFLEDNPELSNYVMQSFNNLSSSFGQWFRTSFLVTAQQVLTEVYSQMFNILSVTKNLLIGLVAAVYMLSSRKKFAAQAKKIIFGLFPIRAANIIIHEVLFINQTFGGFIRGKLLDSLIIGIICFIVCTIMDMPYVTLISLIIGVTNIIPFFGPFIGAVPATILVLTVSPIQSIYFVIFVFILQQFDGNILGPKILGQTTGISGFWVLFSILVFGGMMGFVGMIIGVPAFAVIYSAISRIINLLLRKKHLSTVTDDYESIRELEQPK